MFLNMNAELFCLIDLSWFKSIVILMMYVCIAINNRAPSLNWLPAKIRELKTPEPELYVTHMMIEYAL